jgi:hypothetical protein
MNAFGLQTEPWLIPNLTPALFEYLVAVGINRVVVNLSVRATAVWRNKAEPFIRVEPFDSVLWHDSFPLGDELRPRGSLLATKEISVRS